MTQGIIKVFQRSWAEKKRADSIYPLESRGFFPYNTNKWPKRGRRRWVISWSICTSGSWPSLRWCVCDRLGSLVEPPTPIKMPRARACSSMHARLTSVTLPTEEKEGEGEGGRDNWTSVSPSHCRAVGGHLGHSCLLVLLLGGYLACSPFLVRVDFS